jgi:phosphoglycerate dehydrogenase-like enzyme
MKIVLHQQHRFELWNAPDWAAEQLRARFPQLNLVHPLSQEEMDVEIRDADVAITWSITPEQLASASQLRWVHSPAAAVHLFMFPEFVASDVVLTNARSVHAPVVAEHVIALVFALARQIHTSVRYQVSSTWGQQLLWNSRPRPREVAGTTLGMIGLGSIGAEVVERATALGMNVIAARAHAEKSAEGVSAVYGVPDISKLLAQSDFVVLAAPVTPNTRHLINAERLAQMKPDACLINVGRGSLVDEAAIAQALRTKQIAGAALDVFEEEPLPETSPLWSLENLLITPHTAGLTEKLWTRHVELISENLRRYLSGEPLLGLVDKARGY